MCRLKIFVPVMVLGMVILIPINVGAGSLAGTGTSNANTTANTKFLFSSIDKLSMSNVPNGSTRCLTSSSKNISLLVPHRIESYVVAVAVDFANSEDRYLKRIQRHF